MNGLKTLKHFKMNMTGSLCLITIGSILTYTLLASESTVEYDYVERKFQGKHMGWKYENLPNKYRLSLWWKRKNYSP